MKKTDVITDTIREMPDEFTIKDLAESAEVSIPTARAYAKTQGLKPGSSYGKFRKPDNIELNSTTQSTTPTPQPPAASTTAPTPPTAEPTQDTKEIPADIYISVYMRGFSEGHSRGWDAGYKAAQSK